MKTLKLFLSSPGDVGREREATRRVVQRLADEFSEHLVFDLYDWQWEPVDFGQDYQSQIPSTADFDIVICLLWSRLGSRLAEQYKLPPDYSQVANSGTQYELMQALHGKMLHPEKLPDLLVWVNEAPPPPVTAPPLDKVERDKRNAQVDALHDFLSDLTRDAATGSFVAALNGYQYLDEFEELMEKKLRKLIQKHIGQHTVKPRPRWQGSPFRDLDVFEFEHAPIFFGRTRAIGEVVRLLQSTLTRPTLCHFAIILGASGSGKSSLARAGVLPMLTTPGVIEGIGLWRSAIMRPSDDSTDLFQALAAALLAGKKLAVKNGISESFTPNLLPALPELADPESTSPHQILAEELRAHPETVALRVKDKLNSVAEAHATAQRSALEDQITTLRKEGRLPDAKRKQAALQQLTAPRARLVLLLDQMEELFTLNYAPDHLRAFLAALDVLARSGRVFVIGTLRSDFYARYQEQPTLVALARDGEKFDLLPPTPDEISQIIRRPAHLAGLTFEPAPGNPDHTLADTLRDEALADTEALPLLEHVLNRLWENQQLRKDGLLTYADHTTLGGVGGALGRHAEAVFTGEHRAPEAPPPPWTDATFHAVFGCLVTFGKGESDTDVPNRRAFPYTDLIHSEPHAQALANTFIHERLLIADRDAQGQSIVRLSHEALLTRWPRLAQWLNTAPVRDLMSMRRRLESSLRQWREQNRTPDCYLQPGFELEEGKQLIEKHQAALKSEDREFIKASVAYHAEREQKATRRRRVVIAGLSALTCVALLASVMAWLQAERANDANVKNLSTLHEASMADYAVAVQRIEKDNNWHEGIAYLARSLKWWPDNPLAAARLYSSIEYCAPEKQNWPRQVFRRNASVWCAQFDPTGAIAITAGKDHAALLWDLVAGKPFGEPLQHDAEVQSAQFSPNGARIVTASWDHEARLWDASTGKAIGASMSHDDRVVFSQFSPDGTHVATASLDNTARLWNATTGRPIGKPMRHKDRVIIAKFSADGSRLATASFDGTARVWDAYTGESIGQPLDLGGRQPLWNANFSPDGLRIVTAGFQEAKVWDTTTGRQLFEPLRHQSDVLTAQFSPDGLRIVTASMDSTARIWDAGTGKPIGQPMLHKDGVWSAVYSPDGLRIVTASRDCTACVWDASTGQIIGEPLRHRDNVFNASFSADGLQIITASGDTHGYSPDGQPVDTNIAISHGQDGSGYACIWDPATGKSPGEPLRHDAAVGSAQFSADGNRILTAAANSTARVWDTYTGRLVSNPLSFNERVDGILFSPDGTRIVTGGNDSRVWDTATGKSVSKQFDNEGAYVRFAQFSSDSARIITATNSNGEARMWDAASGKRIGEVTFSGVETAQFSPDGSHIVTTSFATEDMAEQFDAWVWSVKGGKPVVGPMSHNAKVQSACFSPDGTRIVTASADNAARVWDATTGNLLLGPLYHGDAPVYYPGSVTSISAQFSADGMRIVTVGGNNARLWDALSGKALGDPLRHEGIVNSAQFSADGTRIVTASADNTARVWDVKTMLSPPRPVPEWMLQRAQAFAGLVLDADGRMETIPAEKRIAILTAPPPGDESDPWSKLVRWLAKPSDERTLTPDSKFTCRQIAERERDSGYKEGIESALRYDPTVPLAHMLLAKFEENPQRADFLRGYGLKLIPDDANLWARAAMSLVEQQDFKRAQQAAEKTLKLDPNNVEGKKALEAAKEAGHGK